MIKGLSLFLLLISFTFQAENGRMNNGQRAQKTVAQQSRH